MEFIIKIRDKFDLSIFMIEHHMQVVMVFVKKSCAGPWDNYSSGTPMRYKIILGY